MLRVRAAVALLLGRWALPLVAEHEATWQADGLGLPTLAPLPPALDRLKFMAVDWPRGCHSVARELNGTLSRRSAWCAVGVVEFLPRLVEPWVRLLMPSPRCPSPTRPSRAAVCCGWSKEVTTTARRYRVPLSAEGRRINIHKGAAVLGYRVTAAW